MGDPLTREERDGMTVWGDDISAQVRRYGEGESECMALRIHDHATVSSEAGNPALIGKADVDRLRELLNEAERRARQQ